MQWTFLTGMITREHQMEEHFLEYLRNLVELPKEREYLQNLLESEIFEQVKSMDGSESNNAADGITKEPS